MRTRTGVAVALCAAVVLAAVAALARAGDGRSVEERVATLEGQVSRLTSTVAAQNTRIRQLEGGAAGPTNRLSSPTALGRRINARRRAKRLPGHAPRPSARSSGSASR